MAPPLPSSDDSIDEAVKTRLECGRPDHHIVCHQLSRHSKIASEAGISGQHAQPYVDIGLVVIRK